MIHPLDITVIAVFFAGMAAIGLHYALKKDQSAEKYFLGDNLPSWALGLSMLATSISSVTFLAFPAAAYVLDWRQVVPNLTNPLFAILAIWLFIPFFRNSAKTTAYEYLQKRFGDCARLYAGIMFLIAQSLRLGSILYLLVIPVQMMTGLPPVWIILTIGGITAIYTTLGGLSATVWSDVAQSFVLYLGGALSIIFIIHDIPGGFSQMLEVAKEHDKFSLGPTNWDLSERTFWTMIILGLTHWVGGYVADQNVVQRYLAAKSTKEARTATLLCALMSLPTWIFFFFIGTCLFTYYTILPEAAITKLSPDYIFPHFIISRLPPGVSGLVLAGVISAALSSLSSSLNAFSTVSTIDIIEPYLFKNRSPRFYSITARAMTVVGTLVMFSIGFLFLFSEKESFLDLSFKIAGIIGGVTICFFMLGFFAPHVNKKILWQAFSVSFLLNLYLALVEWQITPNFLGIKIHAYWVSTLVIWFMIILALLLAWIQKSTPDTRKGMTLIYPRKIEKDTASLGTTHEQLKVNKYND